MEPFKPSKDLPYRDASMDKNEQLDNVTDGDILAFKNIYPAYAKTLLKHDTYIIVPQPESSGGGNVKIDARIVHAEYVYRVPNFKQPELQFEHYIFCVVHCVYKGHELELLHRTPIGLMDVEPLHMMVIGHINHRAGHKIDGTLLVEPGELDDKIVTNDEYDDVQDKKKSALADAKFKTSKE